MYRMMQSYALESEEACSACDRACLHSRNCASRLIKPPPLGRGLGVGFRCWEWGFRVLGVGFWALSLTLQRYEKVLKLPNCKHEKLHFRVRKLHFWVLLMFSWRM